MIFRNRCHEITKIVDFISGWIPASFRRQAIWLWNDTNWTILTRVKRGKLSQMDFHVLFTHKFCHKWYHNLWVFAVIQVVPCISIPRVIEPSIFTSTGKLRKLCYMYLFRICRSLEFLYSKLFVQTLREITKAIILCLIQSHHDRKEN